MTTTKRLAQYTNGNCRVTLMSDGTKTREWEGTPAPEFPESIDLKITNMCDHACAHCHERSVPDGQHATYATIEAIVAGLPAGVEIAIGGGNPLNHPELEWILELFKRRGLIANITVNADHYPQTAERIVRLQAADLLYGVGISVADAGVPGFYRQLVRLPENLVWHFVAGVVTVGALLHYNEPEPVLVLGYKRYGRGVAAWGADTQARLAEWRYWMGTILRRITARGQVVCFDNLALKQLNVQALVDPATWQRHYMGDDGQFTMYVDAVTDTYAPSSTVTRVARYGQTIREMFASVRGGW